MLLESRLGQLASNSDSTDLAKGAEALQLLMGRANASQEALEKRERLLAEALGLLASRQKERRSAVGREAEQREASGVAVARLDGALARFERIEALAPGEQEELRGIGELLRAAQAAGEVTVEALAREEMTLTSSLSRFTAMNNELQSELQAAMVRIAELELRLKGHGAAAPPPTHRPPPGKPASARAAAVSVSTPPKSVAPAWLPSPTRM